jgi:hypothetical protein
VEDLQEVKLVNNLLYLQTNFCILVINNKIKKHIFFVN